MNFCCSGRFGGLGAVVAVLAGMAVAHHRPDQRPGEQHAATAPKSEAAAPYVLDFKMKRIDGKEEDLRTFQGRVILMVNVASKCGLTPQYEALEKLYQSKKEQGFVVLGFPADNFGHQEPGSNTEIAEFCKSKYSVTFPMYEKVSVVSDAGAALAKAKNRPITGGDQHPLFQRLSGQPAPIGGAEGAGDPKWNFTKFLVDRSGNVVARFEPKVTPDDPELVSRIDQLLAAKAKAPEATPQNQP